jgi:hypothetical protein
MRLRAALLSISALVPAAGQSRAARDADAMAHVVRSRMVEYRPALDRDPFVAPSDQAGQNQGGFSIDEITVKGKIVIDDKPYAIILDPLQNVLQIQVGYRLLDGEVTAITENAVVFDQWDAASQGRSGKRSVTKIFKREEEKR